MTGALLGSLLIPSNLVKNGQNERKLRSGIPELAILRRSGILDLLRLEVVQNREGKNGWLHASARRQDADRWCEN